MLVEQFYGEPTRSGYSIDFSYISERKGFKHGFFMEYLYENEVEVKNVIIDIVSWAISAFGFYDKNRIDFESDEEGDTFAVFFRDEEDAAIFKMNPPFDIEWTDGSALYCEEDD